MKPFLLLSLTIALAAFAPRAKALPVSPEPEGGGTVTETRILENFTSLEISGAGCVIEIVCQQQTPSVSITGEASAVRRVSKTIEVEDGTLQISGCNAYKGQVVIKVSVPALERVEVSGAGIVVKITNMSGKGLAMELSGASVLEVSGKVKKLSIETSGPCVVKAGDLVSDIASVEADGAAQVDVNVVKELCASASGVSRVIYRGKPPVVRRDVDGWGIIKSKE